MTTFLAIADRSTATDEGRAFRLEKARIGVLHGGHVYTYLPNDSSWVYNEGVERDYFADKSELQYCDLPAPLACSLALCMRPMNPLVASMLLENSSPFPKIPNSEFHSLWAPKDLAEKRVFLAKWILNRRITLPKGVEVEPGASLAGQVSNFQRDEVARKLGRLRTTVSLYERVKKEHATPGRRGRSGSPRIALKPLEAAGATIRNWPTRTEKAQVAADLSSSSCRHLP